MCTKVNRTEILKKDLTVYGLRYKIGEYNLPRSIYTEFPWKKGKIHRAKTVSIDSTSNTPLKWKKIMQSGVFHFNPDPFTLIKAIESTDHYKTGLGRTVRYAIIKLTIPKGTKVGHGYSTQCSIFLDGRPSIVADTAVYIDTVFECKRFKKSRCSEGEITEIIKGHKLYETLKPNQNLRKSCQNG